MRMRPKAWKCGNAFCKREHGQQIPDRLVIWKKQLAFLYGFILQRLSIGFQRSMLAKPCREGKLFALIDRNAQKPMAEMVVAFKGFVCLIQLEEDLLHHIVGIMGGF